MEYEALLKESDSLGLVVKEKPLKYNDGRIKGSRIAIRKDLETSAEKICVLAEELGHYHTAIGDILDQSDTAKRKLEQKGRISAYNKLVGLHGIIDAYKHHCQSIEESAEYLGVTLEFLNDALAYYKSKYGICTTLGSYAVFFEPAVAVLELLP